MIKYKIINLKEKKSFENKHEQYIKIKQYIQIIISTSLKKCCNVYQIKNFFYPFKNQNYNFDTNIF